MRAPFLHMGMAILVFLSASGLLMNVHYCQDERKGASLFTSSPTCHDLAAERAAHDTRPIEATAKACPLHPEGMPDSEKDCCDDVSQYLKVEQEQTFQLTVLHDLPLAGLTPLASMRLLIGQWDARTLHFLNHKPPLLRGDPHAELQVFRC